jgi:hypothetical protein
MGAGVDRSTRACAARRILESHEVAPLAVDVAEVREIAERPHVVR